MPRGNARQHDATPPKKTGVATATPVKPPQLQQQKQQQQKVAKLPEKQEARLDVTFSIQYHTRFGQNLHLLSELPELEGWTPTSTNRMSWIGNGFWQLAVPLVRGRAFHYKYAVVNADGQIERWEELPANRAYDGFKHSQFDEWDALSEAKLFASHEYRAPQIAIR